jgi:alkanesulfonate monooxygenase SsuD/methylene tetrahydromethanopterin reductase-like flavin-dependent oxidoreductase (luciferase family)
MKFGLFFINEKPPGMSDEQVIKNALEQCTLADELGFDSVWLGEHHFAPYGTMADTLLFGAAVSQVTKTINIGTAVIVPTFTHPVRVAEQIAMLDVMSGGRFWVGLGRGYQEREFNGYGVPQSQSKARFREATEIIDGLLSHENFSYDGQFWTVKDLTIAPMPMQKPRPPIYIAGSATPDSVEWLVEKNYRCLTGNPYSLDPGSSDEIGNMLTDTQKRLGKTVSMEHAWGLLHNILVADTDELAAETFKPNWTLGNDYLFTYARVVEEGSEIPADYAGYEHMHALWDTLKATDYDDVVGMRGSLIGSSNLVAEKLARLYEDTGFTKQLLWMNRGGAVPQKDILRSMELFATEVMPQVADIGEQDEAAQALVTAY